VPYHPDWALIKKEDGEETQNLFRSRNKDPKAAKIERVRDSERMKIACAENILRGHR
jgi:type III restriction enzyme